MEREGGRGGGGDFVKIGQFLDQRRGKGAAVGGNWGKEEGKGEK